MDRILRTIRAGGKGGDSHHLASLTDSKYSVTRTAGVIGTYGFSRFFPQVNLRVEATSQPWFTCLFLQLRLPCCTIATKKTFRTTPRIRLDPNQRVYYRLETQLSIYSEIESNVATQSFGIWRCRSFVCSSCCIANWLYIPDSSSYDQQPR